MLSASDLINKRALVTGARGLLGAAAWAALVANGAEVGILDNAYSGRDWCDLADGASVEFAVARFIGTFKRVDVLVVADRAEAGYMPPILHCVPQYMMDHQRGSIILLSSIYGMVGPDSRIYEGQTFNGNPMSCPPEYAAEKGAIIALTKHLACEWARHGIRVNCISPGGVYSGQPDEFVKRYSDRVPMGRMATPEEIANAVVFLASDASSYITGHNLVVDGGLTAW